MPTKFIVRGYIAHSEQDFFEDGCIGKGKSRFDSEYSADAPSFAELIATLSKDFSAKWEDSPSEYKGDFILDCCDEPGRLDIQVHQRQAFECSRPSEQYLEKWKAGNARLWLTNYTFQVVIEQSEPNLVLLVNGGGHDNKN